MAWKNRKTLKQRLEALTTYEPNTGCHLFVGTGRGGYGRMRVTSDPKDTPDGAHRVAYREYVGLIPDGMQVCHACDVRACVNPDHLFLGTASDNMSDAARKGRMNWKAPRDLPKGDKHHGAKLTWEQVEEIRASNEPGIALARKYGVSNNTISRVRRRLNWK